jgi:hypothetical protein
VFFWLSSVLGLRRLNQHIENTGTSSVPLQVPKTTCWVTSESPDGFGHQLHGMITVMGLHGVRLPEEPTAVFQYDATPHHFRFAHVSSDEAAVLESFMQKVMGNFKNQRCHEYRCDPDHNQIRDVMGNQYQHVQPILNGTCVNDHTYVANSAFYSIGQDEAILDNIRGLAPLMRDALPDHNLPNGTSLVIHIRLGDSGQRGIEPAKRVQGVVGETVTLNGAGKSVTHALLMNKITSLLSELQHAYDNIIIHTDDAQEAKRYFHEKFGIKIYGFEFPLLIALNQMINADTLITSASSLSHAAALLRSAKDGKEHIFVPHERASHNMIYPPHTLY